MGEALNARTELLFSDGHFCASSAVGGAARQRDRTLSDSSTQKTKEAHHRRGNKPKMIPKASIAQQISSRGS